MSLSQKHAGLILVPWFNSDEWRYVYHSVYSNDRDKQLNALDLLKIWKSRTPILSTGVEGTLILLDVLLLDTDSLSEEQITNFYAIALMRFLNLSAANSSKQGAFTKTSVKNELPKWLVNLRHDIAHGHQIPSLYNLKMGLEFGFHWLKEKYWEPQSKLIQDYYIREDSGKDNHLLNSLKAYAEITLALFENRDVDNEYLKGIKDNIYKKFKRNIEHPYLMLDILLEMIKQSLERQCKEDQKYLDAIVSGNALLKPNFCMLEEENAEKCEIERMDKNFKKIWQSLLNTLHQFGLIFVLLNKLFNIVGDISYPDNFKKMAALWINELLISLQCLKESSEAGEDSLKMESNSFDYDKEALNFQKHVLNCFNEYRKYFLDSLFKYNNLDDTSFNNDVLNLVSAETCDTKHHATGKIYSLDDLKIENLGLDDVLEVVFQEEEKKLTQTSPKPIVAGKKWAKIEDTSMFKNCPLGVLPHQIGQKHPFLVLR